MNSRKRSSTRRPFAFGILALAIAALLVAWGQHAASNANAQIPIPSEGIEFSLSVNNCDTRDGDVGKCVLDPGEEFVVNVSLDSLPDIEGYGAEGYEGFDIQVLYTGALTSMDNPDTSSWPDCGFPAHFITPGEAVLFACSLDVGSSPSTYTGVIGTLGFTCSEDEAFDNTISLVHGSSDTGIQGLFGVAAEGEGTTDTLTIHCGEPPTPTPEPDEGDGGAATATALPPTGNALASDGDGGTGTALWITIGALLAAAAAGMGALGLRFGRSR
jgi:hypothetical protein